jgi:hypothetical protein
MDAIESVRINRLYQQGGSRQRDDEEIQQPRQLILPTQQKHHVALDSADTSQGAVHAFKDGLSKNIIK